MSSQVYGQMLGLMVGDGLGQGFGITNSADVMYVHGAPRAEGSAA
jgi:hypothetical protein